jgi:hypothetical protein
VPLGFKVSVPLRQWSGKNKAGPTPCFEIFPVFTPVASELFFFWSGLRLIAPPVLPPSDLDHTRARGCQYHANNTFLAALIASA